MRERHALRKLGVVGISREDRSTLYVVRRGDMSGLTLSWRAEHPVVVGKQAQCSRGPAVVGQCEQREFHGIVDVHEYLEVVAKAARRPRKTGDSSSMLHDELPARHLPCH